MKLKQTGRNGGRMTAEGITTRDCNDRSRHLSPNGFNATTYDAPQAPGNLAGSFLFGGFTIPLQPRFVRPTTPDDAEYARYPTRPIDRETGLPLCFYAPDDLPEIVGPNLARIADWDHQFTKVATKNGYNPILDLPGARYGLMHLRLQWVSYDDHHNKWNNYKYLAPQQPGTPEQLAATMAFGLAGYVPRVGLKLRRQNFIRIVLKENKRRELLLSGQIKTQSDEEILTYLQWYVVNQKADHIKANQLDEFIATKDPVRRLALGTGVARLLMERAADPINLTYVRAKKEGLLYVRKSNEFVKPPDSAGDFLYLKLADELRVGALVASTFRAVKASMQHSKAVSV